MALKYYHHHQFVQPDQRFSLAQSECEHYRLRSSHRYSEGINPFTKQIDTAMVSYNGVIHQTCTIADIGEPEFVGPACRI